MSIDTSAALIIDAERMLVTLDGRSIHLQRKQYRLLTILATDPARCFTYEQIARGIWGDAFKRGNALRSQVSLLRGALGDRFVVNVHSIGYRLVQPDSDSLVECIIGTTT